MSSRRPRPNRHIRSRLSSGQGGCPASTSASRLWPSSSTKLSSKAVSSRMAFAPSVAAGWQTTMHPSRSPKRVCHTCPGQAFRVPISGLTTSRKDGLSWPHGASTFQTVPEKSASCLTSSRLTARNAFTARSFEWGLAHAEISQFSARQPLFGRPNISGDAGIFLYYGQGDESFLYQGSNGAVNRSGADGNMNYHILFDASRISNIYGSSSVVQPASSRFLACIKS